MLDKAILAGTAAFVAISGWAALLPAGAGLPFGIEAILAVAFIVLLLGHMSKHLGQNALSHSGDTP